jgi:hypothetical protein
MTFWNKYSLKMSFPPICCAFMGTILLVKRAKMKVKFQREKLDDSRAVTFKEFFKQIDFAGYPPLFFTVVVSLYAFIVSSTVGPLVCQKQADGRYTMIHSPSELCYSGDWNRYLPAVVIFGLLYCIMFPAMVIWYFWKHHKDLDDPEFVLKFGSLTSAYRRKYFYWEFFSMTKRALFVLISEFLGANKSDYIVRLCLTTSIVAVFSFLDAYCRPYSTRAFNLIAST